ncbi:MAG: hypothetical protein CML56_00890, partial [Rhodobacteraceae bacterium]|nr:hypothetical protein [Paracoccaceae bacterium]
RKIIQEVLDEATMLVTYDDGSEDEFNVTDRFAKKQSAYLETQISDRDLEPGSRAPIESDYAAGVEDSEKGNLQQSLSSSRLHPDPEINKIIEERLGVSQDEEGRSALEIFAEAIDAEGLGKHNLQQIRRVVASFSKEEAQLLRSKEPTGEIKVSGNWSELMTIQQGREGAKGAVGQGEVLTALLCPNASLSAGAAHDITIGGSGYHVKYHADASAKSGLPTKGTANYSSSLKSGIDALTFTISKSSTAAKQNYTEDMLKADLIAALTAQPVSKKAKQAGLVTKSAEFGQGTINRFLEYTGIPEAQLRPLGKALNAAYYAALGGPEEGCIIAKPGSLHFGTVEELLYVGTMTSSTIRAYANVFGKKLGLGKILGESMEMKKMDDLRLLIRETLLMEELNKSDKKEIERIAKKQASKIVASELDKALGASFFGTKGKVNKFVSDEVSKRFKQGRRDPDFADTVETICKEILKKFHRDMALKYPQMVDRIKIR